MIFSSEKILFRTVVNMKDVLFNITDWYKSLMLQQRRQAAVHPTRHASCARALEDGPFNQARDHVLEEEPTS